MIPAALSAQPWSYLWQVAVHAAVMGLIFYAWTHRVRLPSGRTKRRLLTLLLVLPMITAAVPGRSGVDFAERSAWFNSARILAVPLVAGVRLYHVVLLAAVVIVSLTIWQELLPSLRRRRASIAALPESLVRLVRERPGWERCAVAISPLPSIMLVISGWPLRPRLTVSCGAIESLSEVELAAVVAHEHAHWDTGRWLSSHALFLVRLLQCYHPVALWAFREYCIEMEVGCDAVAVSGRDPNTLVRVLLRIYQATDRRDVGTRGALRKRVDVLMSGGPRDAALPSATLVAAAIVMLLVLPWIV